MINQEKQILLACSDLILRQKVKGSFPERIIKVYKVSEKPEWNRLEVIIVDGSEVKWDNLIAEGLQNAVRTIAFLPHIEKDRRAQLEGQGVEVYFRSKFFETAHDIIIK